MMSTMVKAQLQLQMISARVTMMLLMVKLAVIVIAQTTARNGANVKCEWEQYYIRLEV